MWVLKQLRRLQKLNLELGLEISLEITPKTFSFLDLTLYICKESKNNLEADNTEKLEKAYKKGI